ncbi:MAG: glycoside hydrolase family 15 protein [Polyangiaceae bacterium]|nr:glycoside hydrolase family 15 protein [Polyangiaceae bacterium]
MSRHVYDMGVVGNCAFLAHVDARAEVVWMCLPRFDSSFVFGHLLDPQRGGVLAVEGIDPPKVTRQAYVWNTNVLVTDVELPEGSFRVTDCAPRFVDHGRIFKPLMLVRKIEPLSSSPRVKIVCRPRGEYGLVVPRTYPQSNHLRYDIGQDTVRLHSNVPLSYIANESPFVLGEKKYLIFTWGPPFEGALEDTAEEYIRRTVEYWQKWVENCAIGRFYQREVIRSALVLKLHQYEDTGAIIASGTTSLPEFPGSGRNWDYRFCWLRDAHFTLTALARIGQFEEMKRFAEFIENIVASAKGNSYPPAVRIVGTMDLPEQIIPLSGYDEKGLVRVGNAAYAQRQNDIYGQIIYALLKLYVDERFPREPRTASKHLIATLLGIIDARLDEPDASLWEFRGIARRHCYTALCHWVGAKSAGRIARELDDHAMRRAATRLTARSERMIEACYDSHVGAYMQEPGSHEVDASTLQLIILSYLDPHSERAAKHLEVLERRLITEGGLMHRYTHPDDFGAPESAFLVCSFWYVEALAAMGRVEEALRELETLLTYSNSLGLFSEDVDPATGGQWGNFPQTYSHVGLINAVLRVTSKIEYPEFY